MSNLPMLNQNEQIGLSELSIYNWGVFNGLFTGYFDPVNGTFITGANGSGKTTFIDAYQLLFLPPAKTLFNLVAAQGNKKDRDTISYIRGDFGSTEDNGESKVSSKRSKGTVSGIRGLFKSTSGRYVIATVLLYITSTSRKLSDVKRIYLLSEDNVKLEDIINNFSDDVRELKRKFPQINFFTGTGSFDEYIERFKRLIGIKNANAIPLMFRVQGTKQINNVDEMLRTHVLDSGDLPTLAQNIIDQFSSSEEIYYVIQDTIDQIDALTPLQDLKKQYVSLDEKLLKLEQEQAGLPIFIAKRKHSALTQLKEKLLHSKQEKEFEIKKEIELLENLEENIHRQERDYSKNGGDKIVNIEEKIKSLETLIKTKEKFVTSYQKLCQSLGLSAELNESALANNTVLVEQMLANEEKLHSVLQDEFNDVGVRIYELQANITKYKGEIALLKQSQSNIDSRYLQLRERIQDETGVELAFIGELIQVKQEEQRWRGAIERALGDKTTMLVKPEGYKAVTNYLNKNHLGLNVRVEKINDVKDVVVFEDTKFLTKLEWKESDYTPYLKHYLLARDLTCVETVEELNETPYSMTVEGLIHRRQGSFEKADRFKVNDRKMWQTGFSNKDKLAVLEVELTTITDVEYNLNKQKQKLSQDLMNINAKIQLINSFDVDFNDINILPLRKQKKDLEDELKAINKDDLELIKSKIEETRTKAREKRDRLDKLNKQLGSLEWELTAKEQALNECADDAQKQVDETLYHFEFDFISSKDETVAKNYYKNELEKINKDLNKVNNDIVLIMGQYRGVDKWRQYSADFGNKAENVDEYLSHLNKLIDTDLPQQKDNFKQRMEKHTVEGIINFVQTANDECNKIIRNIQKINPTLEKVDYVDNTYLQLVAKQERFDNLIQFNNATNLVVKQFEETNVRDRYAKLKDVVDILRDALNSSTLDAKRLLDPRYRFSFAVNVIHRQTKDVNTITSSSGKSGGEKEVFASLILAASLAYVLTNDNESEPHFNTIFIDEAFSNTSYENARKGLSGFRNLGLSVNMIMPEGKGYEIGEEFTRKVICTLKQNGEGKLSCFDWEKIECSK